MGVELSTVELAALYRLDNRVEQMSSTVPELLCI